MDILSRPSYTTSLAELEASDFKQAVRFLTKLERNPKTKGLRIEKINNGFVSIKANDEIRVIGQWVGEALMLHYVGHHEDAYDWANKRRRVAELTGGDYRLVANDIIDEVPQIEASSIPNQDDSGYGKSTFDKLVGLGFPINIARHLETVQSEDDLLVRIEELPENILYMALDAIFNDIPYKTHLSNAKAEVSEIVSPEEVLTGNPLPTVAKFHEEIKPTATAIEASTTADVGTQREPNQQNRNAPSDIPLTHVSDKVEAELKRLESRMSAATSQADAVILEPEPKIIPIIESLASELRVERKQKPNSTWWLLQIYDGDTFIGSYEQSKTEDGAKEKEVEILWPDKPDLRNMAADELRRAYKANGHKSFIVRWNGDVIGKEGKKGVKQIKNKETGELLGEFPRCCFRK